MSILLIMEHCSNVVGNPDAPMARHRRESSTSRYAAPLVLAGAIASGGIVFSIGVKIRDCLVGPIATTVPAKSQEEQVKYVEAYKLERFTQYDNNQSVNRRLCRRDIRRFYHPGVSCMRKSPGRSIPHFPHAFLYIRGSRGLGL